jgi:histidine triad (HIT) family protein
MAAVTGPGPCVFCDIAAGHEEASVVHEDEHVVAFMDLEPVNDGHLLVVPRAHAASLEELDEDLGARMFRTAHWLARALRRSELPCEGVNMFLADGAVAFQEVFHVHLHVVPRTVGDGFTIDARWRPRDRGELNASAEQVRRGVRALSPSPEHDSGGRQ